MFEKRSIIPSLIVHLSDVGQCEKEALFIRNICEISSENCKPLFQYKGCWCHFLLVMEMNAGYERRTTFFVDC